ncbi:RNA methyltransferase [Chlamydia trachomatis]|jgi:rRNA methylases|uniref:23S rRNA methyltransferase n=2 Tax=Chlamydia muridarum TaxID=83560 RepID=A0A069ZZR1_CHLMR|nr:RNA methyltransferase [Chlamydia muridarum]UFT35837.1 RNA methyltransferase [Chlamydia trachomatis]AAF73591.1 spoU rRNA methylase family protein [Chlamydia muridarum str. Nigg]AHH23069.1 23S rRNA methyltransferase [Chlamydia muridarum str. Nigg3 CMUT3-5]AHH23994.1 23S rRNA methyltransferase [Chlamydia muridarum str. Nigg CM972]AID38201.1 23S rRNA methyltransferase [Chlamydia muridarum str. Nigg 2 MCR]
MEFIGKNNARVKAALALKRQRARNSSYFLLEGFREIHRALISGYHCLHVFCGELISDKERDLDKELTALGIEKLPCPKEILERLSFKEHPDNFIAVFEKKRLSCQEFLRLQRKNQQPFYLIVEQAEKPGNIGALLRIADGAGVDGVILCDPVVDLYNPNVIRSSLGAVFTVPIWQASLEEVLALVREQEWKIFTTTPSTQTFYFDQNFCQPLAVVFGSEKDGLSPSWLDGSFCNIALPMLGKADSLNLSSSVAAVAYEVVRQRSR